MPGSDSYMRQFEPELGKDGHETSSGTTTPNDEPSEGSLIDVFHDCVNERSVVIPGGVRHGAESSPQRLAQ